MKLISVVVPIYNVEEYLRECVDSIISQTYSSLEIILVDDGSTDNCPAICDEYATKDNRIKVIHKANGGLSDARNAGIDVASGKYITFIDSDDCIAVDMLEQLMLTAEQCGAEISACNYTNDSQKLSVEIDEKAVCLSTKEALYEILAEKGLTTSAWGKLFKTELFCDVRFPVGKIYEDYATIYKLFAKTDTLAYSEAAKYYYRTNPNSITQVTFSEKQLDYYYISNEVYKFISLRYPELKQHVINRETKMSIAFFKKMSASGFSDKEIIAFMTSNVRKNIFKYMFSRYPLLSKAYGIAICISPKIALKLFRR